MLADVARLFGLPVGTVGQPILDFHVAAAGMQRPRSAAGSGPAVTAICRGCAVGPFVPYPVLPPRNGTAGCIPAADRRVELEQCLQTVSSTRLAGAKPSCRNRCVRVTFPAGQVQEPGPPGQYLEVLIRKARFGSGRTGMRGRGRPQKTGDRLARLWAVSHRRHQHQDPRASVDRLLATPRFILTSSSAPRLARSVTQAVGIDRRLSAGESGDSTTIAGLARRTAGCEHLWPWRISSTSSGPGSPHP